MTLQDDVACRLRWTVVHHQDNKPLCASDSCYSQRATMFSGLISQTFDFFSSFFATSLVQKLFEGVYGEL